MSTATRSPETYELESDDALKALPHRSHSLRHPQTAEEASGHRQSASTLSCGHPRVR
jgi:hypothetical protein